VTVSWQVPASDGGTPIQNYRLQMSVDGGTTWTNAGSSTTTSRTVANLTPGVEHRFRVRAYNGGFGPWSDVVTATPLAAPLVITGLTATPGAGSVALAWTAPANDGGSPIQNYRLQVSSNGGTTWSNAGSSTLTSRTVTGLAPGVEHRFRVRAFNGALGPWSPVATATPS